MRRKKAVKTNATSTLGRLSLDSQRSAKEEIEVEFTKEEFILT